MALLNFPENPVNGQLFPNPCPTGVTQYRWEQSTGIWRIVGVASGVTPGTYGGLTFVGKFTVDVAGVLTSAENVQIQGATTSLPGLVQLTNSTTSIDETKALTAKGAKALQDQIGNLTNCIVPSHINVVDALNDLQTQSTALQTNAMIWCGYYNAEEGDISYVSISGTRLGYLIGQELPTPSVKNGGDFFIVTRGGNPFIAGDFNAPDTYVDVGNWIISEGSRWSEVNAQGGDITASRVVYKPSLPLTALNVQGALDQVTQLLKSGGVGGATISVQPPANPYLGQLWWDSEAGYFYIYYRDINGDQWVEVGGGGSELLQGSGGGTVVEVNTGVGLTGGPITISGEISLLPATEDQIGGVIPGVGLDYDPGSGLVAVDLTANYNGASPNIAFSQAGANALAGQIAALVGSNTLAGTYDAEKGLLAYATPAGKAKGFEAGKPLPPARRDLDNYYVIVTVGGPYGPDGIQPSGAGDWWIVQGDANTIPEWILIDFENLSAAAENVSVRSIPGIDFASNVQTALEAIELQAQDRIEFAIAKSEGIKVSVTDPDLQDNDGTTLSLSLNYSDFDQKGIVQLTNDVTGNSDTLAVCQSAVNAVNSKIDALAGANILAGSYDSNRGVMTGVTPAGAANGFVVGLQAPAPDRVKDGYYIVVTVGGGFGPPTARVPTDGFQAGDWFVVENEPPYAAVWLTLDYDTRSTTAQQVAVSPIPNLSATNVQVALLQMEDQVNTCLTDVITTNRGIDVAKVKNKGTFGYTTEVELQPATATDIGGVFVAPNNGLTLAPSGGLAAAIAGPATLGSIKVGSGLSVDQFGLLSVDFPDSGVTKIIAGSGIFISPTSGVGDVRVSAKTPEQIDDISPLFDGTRQVFTLSIAGRALNPVSEAAILVVLGGIVQTAVTAYTVAANQITFTEPPAANTAFYGISF